MNTDEMAELAERDLIPLLAVTATRRPPPANRRRLGGRDAPGNDIWVGVPGGIEVAMKRSLPLTRWEAALLDPYGRAIADLENVPAAVARNAKDDVVLRAIAAQLGGQHQDAVEGAMRFLLSCASFTYEGEPVHINLLLDLDLPGAAAPIGDLEQYREHDWYALLGSGLESGIELDQMGAVTRTIDLRSYSPEVHGNLIDDSLRPDAFRCIGEWTRNGRRVALSLARSREILIHQEGQLRYVYRSGRWRGLPLDVALATAWSAGGRMGPDLKRSILASAIDASLGHHGACIAVVARGQKIQFEESQTIADADRWPGNVRASLLPSASFPLLTRRHRLELVSMDGALVLDHGGRILAAGSIVRVPGGSLGGGRLAAAKELAKFGAAFKVSQDGPITLFSRTAVGNVEQLMAIA